MRLHLVSLPHTQTTRAYESCAFTSNVRVFATMMHRLGHEVILYASEDNEAECKELVTCITKVRQRAQGYASPEDALKLDYTSDPVWRGFNARVIGEIDQRIDREDIICVATGDPSALPIVEAFPGIQTCEFTTGYKGTLRASATHHRVFPSRAWQHYVYGRQDSEGFFYDEVIPHYFEAEDFPQGSGDGGYFLFVGRLNAWKGLEIAQATCEQIGARLLVAGQGDFSGYGEYVGRVGVAERAELMGAAIALFAPTYYVEPFGKVVAEAQLCGTPCITTDFGAFPELVSGGGGVRASSLSDFIEATESVRYVDRDRVRVDALRQWSTEAVGPLYESYFDRLHSLHGDGWYQLPGGSDGD